MDAYAVLATGGKQYLVKQNEIFETELMDTEKGQTKVFETVLAVSNGTALKVGAPYVAGATVTVEVVEQFRGEKVVSFKKKRRKGYKRKVGHRQELVKVKVTSIAG